MANDAQKRIVEQNEKTICNLKRALLILMTLCALLHAIRFRSLHFSRILVAGASAAVIYYCFRFLERAARPSVGSDNQLHGNRLITEGIMYNTIFDVIYLFSFCLFLHSFSDIMTWAYLLLPIFVLIVLWIKVIRPWLFKSRFTEEGQAQKDAQTMQLCQKYQEKQEKGRRRYKY